MDLSEADIEFNDLYIYNNSAITKLEHNTISYFSLTMNYYNCEICLPKVTQDHIRTVLDKYISENNIDISMIDYKMLRDLLKKCKLPYYKNLSFIGYFYLGFPLPDITPHLKNKMINQYIKISEEYDSLILKRKSCLNSNFILFKLLQFNGCYVDPYSVYEIKTKKS
mgnify:CR=1 FL=1